MVESVFINDPEEGLDEYRIENNDQSKTMEIGPAEFPGPEWYAAYQEREREQLR